MASDRFWNTEFAWLRYAIAWLGFVAMRALLLLPFRLRLALGRGLGLLAHASLRSRRRVAERNLTACFPALPAPARAQLVRDHFAALGASLAEMATGWFGSPESVRKRVRIEGEEELAAALARGKGVILFGAHFTTIEFVWPALAAVCPRLTGMYKWQRNPVLNRMMTHGRARHIAVMITKDDVREMLRQLAANAVVWYASDQSFTGKTSVLIPFFGVPAMTNTAIARIARISGAAVLPYSCRRVTPDDYRIRIHAQPPGLPSGDAASDTRALIAVLEDDIRLCPEQYWWVHQRFKGRPPPLPDLYSTTAQTA